MRTLILGLGNEVLRDDGVGLLAARRVAELADDSAVLHEASGATVDLLPVISGFDRVVVIDAYISTTDPPGTAVHTGPEKSPPGFGYRSFHTLPFGEMLTLGRRLGMSMPRTVSIHGLCVEDPGTFGNSFTPAVGEAWPEWAESIARLEFGRRRPRTGTG